ncbi:Ran gtpase-activating protein [Thalictrum thalictroides]|uniref:Ran gtpase-activating protein n=1 Tax=Thalictrum thalictroides TaxID=46969 RepID=A0A7J6V6J4_THATH|nr:Ran gtpase-activating protein [Thalictrum thalictroides]
MFGVEAGVALSQALSSHVGLVEAYLSYLILEDEGAIALANAFKECTPSLEVLEMAGNDITAEAAPALASCIASKHLLKKLNLSDNKLKDEGAIRIGNALVGLKQLKEVDMSTNQIRSAGARVLALSVIEKPEFQLLNLNENFISDEGIDEVTEMFARSPGILGPFDENDPEGEDGDDKDEEEDDENELGLQLGNLEVNQED